jgi:hypothetical protein
MVRKTKAAGLAPEAAHDVTHIMIIPFPTTTATCADCGTSVRRKHDEVWKLRCVQCWSYLKHYRAIVAFHGGVKWRK